ncbi:MAG: ECF transporter S component [Candidatus Bathyarchaeota archaeon]|nr:ECF transporter S component [Candidatus Bathyarchaeum tardum]WGM90289.1 MAG: ECF transporter S component [Candidatus Bathyarchaeum tardum]WNZ29623.1 MAG: ECF transporter S component [Candidatus Bathyarchaeota archaeon]
MNNQSNSNNTKKVSSALRVARISIFTALSVIGSFISPYPVIPTIALDSSPGFFAALYFGVIDGLLITGLGHIVTAVVNGFPLGTLHYIIAIGMALAGGAMGLVNKSNKKWGFIPGAAAAVAINTVLSVIMVPTIGWAATITNVTIPLLLAASLNAAIAAILYVAVRNRRITT